MAARIWEGFNAHDTRLTRATPRGGATRDFITRIFLAILMYKNNDVVKVCRMSIRPKDWYTTLGTPKGIMRITTAVATHIKTIE
jgi:hypothetical protein